MCAKRINRPSFISPQKGVIYRYPNYYKDYSNDQIPAFDSFKVFGYIHSVIITVFIRRVGYLYITPFWGDMNDGRFIRLAHIRSEMS
jgi:hypothetical protein